MKKILYVTTVSRTINAFLIPHIERLIEEGYKVDCACSIDKKIDKSIVDKGCNIFDIPFSRNPLDIKNVKAFKTLVKLQEENQYDIVHVHTPVAGVYGRLLKLKFPNLKTIYTVHGFHFYKGAPFINWIIYYPIEKFMAKLTDTMITINSEDYNESKSFKTKDIRQINGVGVDLSKYKLEDKEQIRMKLKIKEDNFIIIMIAEINKNKNHKQLIDSIEILKNKGIENIQVLCVGDGVLFDEVKKNISERGLDENIKMLGFRNDINELISACDIGILLSYREGLPRNIMELMACKKPVIGTNIRGVRDLIQDNINGFLVGVGDSEDTANKIEKIYNDRKLLKKMSEEAYRTVQDYDVNVVLDDLMAIF